MNFPLCRISSNSSIAAVLLTAVALTVTGCSSFDTSQSGPSASPAALTGSIHGGPNPVNNATVTLWATTSVAAPTALNNYGYGQPGTLLGTTTTNSAGSFSFTSPATCPSGQQAYMVAAGGNTGSNSANSASLLMAAVGPCSSLSTSTYVWIDEPSTIAAAYALSGFMTVSGTTVSISAPANNNAVSPSCTGTGASMSCASSGLAHAFLNAANLVHASNSSGIDATAPTGLAYSTLTTNSKGVVPQSTIHALANSVEACTNSSGATSSACTTLMTNATPPTALDAASAVPTTTLQAMLDLAQYPTPANAAAIFNIGSSIGYYSPAISAAPTDWTLAIEYTGSGTTNFAAPWFVATDISDNVYVTDDTNGFSVFSLSSDGAPNWVTANVNGSNAVIFSSAGDEGHLITDAVNGYVYAPEDGFLYQLKTSNGTLNQTAIAAPSGGDLFSGAVDKNGNFFATGFTANPGLSELPVGGSTLTAVNVGGAAVTAQLRDVYLDGSGNIWAGDGKTSVYYAANTGTTAAPAYANAAKIAAGASGADGIEGVPMIDTLGNVWVISDQNIYEIAGGQTSVPLGSATIPAATVVTPDSGVIRFARMDGNNNIFLGAASTGAGFLAVYYTANTAGSASNANIQLNPCNVGAATTCTAAPGLVNVVRGVAVDSTGSLWVPVVDTAASASPGHLLQLMGLGGPSWSQASYGKIGRPY